MAQQPNRNTQISQSGLLDLLALDALRKKGGMTKLQLLHRGLSHSQVTLLEKRGILLASKNALGLDEYKVVDDFIAKLTGREG